MFPNAYGVLKTLSIKKRLEKCGFRRREIKNPLCKFIKMAKFLMDPDRQN